MPMVKIFEILQRTEDSGIVMNSSIQNPLYVIDLLINAQRSYLEQVARSMEMKQSIITGEEGKAIVT